MVELDFMIGSAAATPAAAAPAAAATPPPPAAAGTRASLDNRGANFLEQFAVGMKQ